MLLIDVYAFLRAHEMITIRLQSSTAFVKTFTNSLTSITICGHFDLIYLDDCRTH